MPVFSRHYGLLQHDSHPDQATGDGCTGERAADSLN